MKKPTTRNCSWGYSCEMQWDDLEPTQDGVRFCTDGQEEVYWADDEQCVAQSMCLL